MCVCELYGNSYEIFNNRKLEKRVDQVFYNVILSHCQPIGSHLEFKKNMEKNLKYFVNQNGTVCVRTIHMNMCVMLWRNRSN